MCKWTNCRYNLSVLCWYSIVRKPYKVPLLSNSLIVTNRRIFLKFMSWPNMSTPCLKSCNHSIGHHRNWQKSLNLLQWYAYISNTSAHVLTCWDYLVECLVFGAELWSEILESHLNLLVQSLFWAKCWLGWTPFESFHLHLERKWMLLE